MKTINHWHKMRFFKDEHGFQDFEELLIIELHNNTFYVENTWFIEKYDIKTIHQPPQSKDKDKLKKSVIIFTSKQKAEQFVEKTFKELNND